MISEAVFVHDTAPVVRRVTDRQEQGFILAPCDVESLLTPSEPAYRVIGMLQEVGTQLRA